MAIGPRPTPGVRDLKLVLKLFVVCYLSQIARVPKVVECVNIFDYPHFVLVLLG
jgi:hypothetical protein